LKSRDSTHTASGLAAAWVLCAVWRKFDFGTHTAPQRLREPDDIYHMWAYVSPYNSTGSFLLPASKFTVAPGTRWPWQWQSSPHSGSSRAMY